MVSSRSYRLLLAAAGILVATSALANSPQSFVVVVNSSVQGTNVRRTDLAAVFLKRARWGDGSTAIPVDQSGTSPVRGAFSDRVLQMPVSAVLQYWQRQLMTTASVANLPTVKSTDEDVLEFVARTHGAVAYVSASTPLPPGVKALTVVD